MDFDFLLKAMSGNLVSAGPGPAVTGVSTDSRNIKAGEVFFALKGENFDGHRFVDEAFQKGASAAVVEKAPENPEDSRVYIEVGSTLKALGDLAQAWRKRNDQIDLAAITGSNGKTTTKEMTFSIVSQNYKTLKNTGNFNNLIGLPLTLLELDQNLEMAVVEMGMNEFGEIRRLSQIAQPDVAAITNIGRAHIENLGSIEGVAKAKGEIVEGFKSHTFFVVNADDERVQRVADDTDCKKITYGINAKGSFITGDSIEENGFEGISFNMNIAGEGMPVTLHTIGLHNVMNALCAAGLAYGLGCMPDEIRQGLEKFRPVHQRLEITDTNKGFKLINDAYNANPESMRSAIDELMRLKGSGRAVAVIGDMLELGQAAQAEHRGIGEYLSSKGVDYVITYGNFGQAVLEALSNGTSGEYAKTHQDAASALNENAGEGDLVLIKGSRGMRMEEVIKYLN